MQNTIELESTYAAPCLKSFPLVIHKGDGCYLWDENDKRYLDFVGSIAVTSFGHNHPGLIERLLTQATTLASLSRVYHSDVLAPFLAKLCHMTDLDQAIPMNTGSEAIETAIKVARKWGYADKGIPDNQAEIIVCSNNFHGRTLTAISASSTAQYKDQFGPLTPGFKIIPFNNIEKLKEAINDNTAAFIVEPIQGESGIQIPELGYLTACQEICQQNNVLFICDEIQSGMGRTGKFLACQHESLQPDGVTLGKALGGGLLPVSAFVASRKVMQVLSPGDHGSTFGGNPLASAVALEALTILGEEGLIEASAELGQYFLDTLKSISSPLIQEVRGKGLWIGIEIADDAPMNAFEIRQRLQDNGLLCIVSHGKVLRFAPALTISKQQLDEAIKIIHSTLSDCLQK